MRLLFLSSCGVLLAGLFMTLSVHIPNHKQYSKLSQSVRGHFVQLIETGIFLHCRTSVQQQAKHHGPVVQTLINANPRSKVN